MVKLEEHKHSTENKNIEKAPLPSHVYIPLSQHLGKICNALQVKAGDTVLTGQKIAQAVAHVYSPIHASVSGKVTSIQDWPHPVLGKCAAVIIESDGLDKTQFPPPRPQNEIDNLSAEQIRNMIFEAGIVGMGGASFPAHIKLNPPKPVDTLIINGAECEPYLTGDSRLMIEKTKEVIKGINLIARCLGVKNIYIAIEDNKLEAIKQLKAHGLGLVVKILKSEYPQGGEKQLIKNILGKEVPFGKLPFDIGVVVHNVATVYAIYEAVYLNKPLYERVVTVTGSILSNPKNLLARIGTPIKELIDLCGPLKEEPSKIIIGGPMMGIAQYTDEVPVIKSTTGVLLLNKKEAKAQEEEVCIRCGACVRACSIGLMPCLINLASEKKMWAEALNYNAMDCIECGLCNYVCPAKRKLTQSVKRAKLEGNK
ncbi:MAG: electron transport complex subunit RsxC [Candidatus Omnitrophota bacterium]